MSLHRKVLQDKNFEMNPSKVPIADFPITRMAPIYDFKNVCYNASAEFVDGYGQDSVRNSKAGEYCHNTTKRLMKAIGKETCQYSPVTNLPVIELRPKLYAEALGRCNGNADKALEMCIHESRRIKEDPKWCHAAHTIYKEVYEDQMPKLPQAYAENFKDFADTSKPSSKPSARHTPIWPWALFIFMVMMTMAFFYLYWKFKKD